MAKSGVDKAQQQREEQDAADDHKWRASYREERQKRPYNHKPAGKKKPAPRGIEEKWSARQAADQVLRENGINPNTIEV